MIHTPFAFGCNRQLVTVLKCLSIDCRVTKSAVTLPISPFGKTQTAPITGCSDSSSKTRLFIFSKIETFFWTMDRKIKQGNLTKEITSAWRVVTLVIS
jgi:hypothetical protein